MLAQEPSKQKKIDHLGFGGFCKKSSHQSIETLKEIFTAERFLQPQRLGKAVDPQIQTNSFRAPWLDLDFPLPETNRIRPLRIDP